MIKQKDNFFYLDDIWSAKTRTEEAASNRFNEVANLFASHYTCYLAMPWSSPRFNGQVVNDALRTLVDKTKVFDRVFTVCQTPELIDKGETFVSAGVTDIFSPYVSNTAKWHFKGQGIALHPFPLIPSSYVNTGFSNTNKGMLMALAEQGTNSLSEQVQSQLDIERATFAVCNGDVEKIVEQVWRCIFCETLPVIPRLPIIWPGLAELWQEAVVFWEPEHESLEDVKARLMVEKNNEKQLAIRIQAIRQLKLSYQPDMLLTDLHKLLHELEGYYQSYSYKQLVNLVAQRKNKVNTSEILAFLASLTSSDFVAALQTRALSGLQKQIQNSWEESFFDELKRLRGALS